MATGFAADGGRSTGGGGGVSVRGVATVSGVAVGGGLSVELDVELEFCGTHPVRAASETKSRPESERCFMSLGAALCMRVLGYHIKCTVTSVLSKSRL